jgi:soluble P-type ATPase
MKITIEIHLPNNASATGSKLFKDKICEELRTRIIAIGNATVPECTARNGDTRVETVLQSLSRE